MRTPNAERYIIFERNVIQIQFSFFAACVRILCANQIIYRQNDGEVDAPHCTAGISLRAGRVAQCTVDYMVMYGNEILAYRLESAVPKKCVCGRKEVRKRGKERHKKSERERKKNEIPCDDYNKRLSKDISAPGVSYAIYVEHYSVEQEKNRSHALPLKLTSYICSCVLFLCSPLLFHLLAYILKAFLYNPRRPLSSAFFHCVPVVGFHCSLACSAPSQGI